ncbi:hypothetical protein RRF57_004160 [Xylaria bambusicola]|uniref:Uncharacterized protein n=1 Tax=Xylaria bambusicola TaxID=326684 RepID=A0AAN7YWV8_9PEZI
MWEKIKREGQLANMEDAEIHFVDQYVFTNIFDPRSPNYNADEVEQHFRSGSPDRVSEFVAWRGYFYPGQSRCDICFVRRFEGCDVFNNQQGTCTNCAYAAVECTVTHSSPNNASVPLPNVVDNDLFGIPDFQDYPTDFGYVPFQDQSSEPLITGSSPSVSAGPFVEYTQPAQDPQIKTLTADPSLVTNNPPPPPPPPPSPLLESTGNASLLPPTGSPLAEIDLNELLNIPTPKGDVPSPSTLLNSPSLAPGGPTLNLLNAPVIPNIPQNPQGVSLGGPSSHLNDPAPPSFSPVARLPAAPERHEDESLFVEEDESLFVEEVLILTDPATQPNQTSLQHPLRYQVKILYWLTTLPFGPGPIQFQAIFFRERLHQPPVEEELDVIFVD